MYLQMMKSKIHRATVTEANLNYVGSITIDEEIMGKVGILPNEKVQIVNNHNGARFETYVIKGERNSGTVCLNGAAARLVQPGDIIIIIAYAYLSEKEAQFHLPKVAIMNEKNQIDQLIHQEVEATVL
ncbi:aspartate 1-decarboxylase [Tepidibacillus marianensis]|uniref:aspartate 1-decarboxylase n=1 Tax=Tepidibacillus marianensis TaxID=3131995 RepID=UPI0030D482C8